MTTIEETPDEKIEPKKGGSLLKIFGTILVASIIGITTYFIIPKMHEELIEAEKRAEAELEEGGYRIYTANSMMSDHYENLPGCEKIYIREMDKYRNPRSRSLISKCGVIFIKNVLPKKYVKDDPI